jgi:hypothetical protein
MTEEEWLKCADPHPMLEFLRARASDRKLRLFAVACSRRIWPWIDALGRAAVETAERFADGLASPEELRAARLACKGASGQASWYSAASNPAIAARNAARSAQAGAADNPLIGAGETELRAQAALLRDIFGPIAFRPLCPDRTWVGTTLVELTQAIYDEGAFERLSDLAGAVEQAGCRDSDVLAHCRQPEPHARGCWVVDMIVGKE